jgi:cellulose biosynthesis protein BcsQ
VKGIKGKKAERDVMIVDTPGSFMGVIADAVTEADAIVIVTQPSAKDLEAQGAIEGLIAKMDRVADTLYCVNRADQRSILTKQALDIVSGKSVKPPVIVMDRADYVKADAAGKIAPEINKAAEPEIAALWQAVKGNRHE